MDREQAREQVNELMRRINPTPSGLETLGDVKSARTFVVAIAEAAREMVNGYDQRAREIKASQAEAHPWVGRNVKRTIQTRISRGMWYKGPVEYKTKTERGKVEQMGAEKRGFRNYRPDPGEVFVVSKSGLTAYPFNERSGWELEE